MPIPSRASAWVWASSLAFACAGAAAQAPNPAETVEAPPAGSRDTRLESRRGGTGRDQFIAPVMGIHIQGEGLNLPPEAPQEEVPARPAAKPAATTPGETKSEPPRSTSK